MEMRHRYRPKVRAASAYGRLEMTSETRPPKKSPRPYKDDTASQTVKVATFYDWSDSIREGTSVGLVSQSDHPAFPQRHANAARVAKMKQYYSTGIRMLSGRFFVKEKTSLTKGEREIINGIVQNRGDLQAEEALDDFSTPVGLQSHRDAWLLGKPFNRLSHPMIRGDDPYTCNCHFQNDKNENGCMNCNPSKRFCQQCSVKTLKLQVQHRTSSQFRDGDGFALQSQNEQWTKRRKIPPINSSKGAVYVKNVVFKNKEEPSYVRKRTVVDVYLPRLESLAIDPEPPAPPPSSPVQDIEDNAWWDNGEDSGSDSIDFTVKQNTFDLGAMRREMGKADDGQTHRPEIRHLTSHSTT